MVLGLVALSLAIAFLGRRRLNGRVVEAMERCDIKGHTVASLKALCRSRGLRVGGTKQQLLDRLNNASGHLTSSASSSGTASTVMSAAVWRARIAASTSSDMRLFVLDAAASRFVPVVSLATPPCDDELKPLYPHLSATLIQRWWRRRVVEVAVYEVPFQVLVKDLKGKTLTCYLETTDITEVLKAKIQGKTGIPMTQQRLIFSGVSIEDGRILADYKIQQQSIIHLAMSLPGHGKKGIVKQKQDKLLISKGKSQAHIEMVNNCHNQTANDLLVKTNRLLMMQWGYTNCGFHRQLQPCRVGHIAREVGGRI